MPSDESPALDVERLTKDLRGLSAQRRIELLQDLHGPTSPLTAEQRRMQRAIYRSLAPQERLAAVDRGLRSAVVRTVLADDALGEALVTWRRLSAAARRDALEAVAAAHARICGAPPPDVFWDDDERLGRYHAEAGALVLGEAHLADRGLMLDTVFHVGSYRCQDAWIERYRNGAISDTDALAPLVRELAAFRHLDAWVGPAEDAVAYAAQPCEAHAWDAARGMTLAVLAGLRARP